MTQIIVSQGGTRLAGGDMLIVECIATLVDWLSTDEEGMTSIAAEVYDAATEVFVAAPTTKVTILELGAGTPTEGLVVLTAHPLFGPQNEWSVPSTWGGEFFNTFIAALHEGVRP